MEISKEVRPGDVQSIHRALHLLEAVGAAGDLGVSELSKELSLAVSTVHNMLRTLVHRGYLTNDKGRYRIGPAITAVASRFDPVMSLSGVLPDALVELSQATGHASYGSVLTGDDLQIIASQSAPGPFTATIKSGTRDNPMEYATGRVLVAMTKQPSDWPHFARGAQDVLPRRSTAQWLTDLQTIAETGVCVKSDHRGTISTGVPVWMINTVVLCSIGVSMPAHVVTPESVQTVLETLWEHAERLSAKLGCPAVPAALPSSPTWM